MSEANEKRIAQAAYDRGQEAKQMADELSKLRVYVADTEVRYGAKCDEVRALQADVARLTAENVELRADHADLLQRMGTVADERGNLMLETIQLRTERDQLQAAAIELLRLKRIKFDYGETREYLDRKELAWAALREAVARS